MSIELVQEIAGSRTAKVSTEGATAERYFQVFTSGGTVSELQVVMATGLPVIYSVHPDSDALLVKSRTAKQPPEDHSVWVVTVHYENQDNDGPVSSPEDEKPGVYFGFGQRYQTVAERAYDQGDKRGAPSKPIVNSARQPFDPPVMADESPRSITIVRNESMGEFDPNNVLGFKDTLNKGQVTVAGVKIEEKTGRMTDLRAQKLFRPDGGPYYQVVYEIQIKPEGWARKVLDQGFNENTYEEGSGSDGGIEPINDVNGNPVTEPQLLDGNGRELAQGADPVFLEFDLLWAEDWGNLHLPVNK